MAYNSGLLWLLYGLLLGIVACCFGLLGVPGTLGHSPEACCCGLLGRTGGQTTSRSVSGAVQPWHP